MTSVLSAAARLSAFASETDKVWLMILTIEHPEIDPPIRVVANTEDIVSRGHTYVAYPFELELPADTAEEVPEVQLSFDNIDRVLTDTIRTMRDAATVTIEVVLADTPDVVEAGPFFMTMKDVDYNAAVIAVTLGFEDILNEPFPKDTFTPATHPGIF